MAHILDLHPDHLAKLAKAEEKLGYHFVNRGLLIQALTHTSYAHERSQPDVTEITHAHNERLEFLGDAVIGLVMAEFLMHRFPEAPEGLLSRWRSHLVSRKTLAELASDLDLGNLLFLGRGETRSGGAEKRSILAGTFESLIGAIYLDGGLPPCAQFLQKVFSEMMALLANKTGHQRFLDEKTFLQERTQQLYKTTPVYRVVESWGAEHQKFFRVEILIDSNVVALGDGRSKKEAEQKAALAALEIIGF